MLDHSARLAAMAGSGNFGVGCRPYLSLGCRPCACVVTCDRRSGRLELAGLDPSGAEKLQISA
jgi:hypothetical protein